MLNYTPPRQDMLFLLNEVLEVCSLQAVPGFDQLSEDFIASVIDEAGRFARDIALPLNSSGDREGCHWDDGHVRTPAGFRDAYRAYVSAGWPALHAPVEHGGQGLPGIIGLPVTEMLTSANMGFSFYPGLTAHAIAPIERFAAPSLKATYLPKLVSGEWCGTMNLTEPQCGSDLGLLRTKALPQDDGTYRISGTKIFITAGEHDLTENIVHLVLARMAGAPTDIRGISLFLVPKFLPDDLGRPDVRNGVRCTRLEEKMGIHGSATCELLYENAIGYLVGEPNRGLAAMFTMMNEARIGGGIQGVAVAEIAHQNARHYACNRRQGRASSGRSTPEEVADPIIQHPDLRRMTLRIRSFTEGARGLAYWAGLLADLAHLHTDAAARQRASELLEVLTPIVKAHLSDGGFESTTLAMQCLGGHGYMREWGLEQLARDARIIPIYEGTNGIQAIDLMNRRLLAGGGRSIQALFDEIEVFAADADAGAPFSEMRQSLLDVLAKAKLASRDLQRECETRPDVGGAVAYDYLSLLGVLAMGFIWLRMVKRCLQDRPPRRFPAGFYEAKIETARFFFASCLPAADMHYSRICAGRAISSTLAVELP